MSELWAGNEMSPDPQWKQKLLLVQPEGLEMKQTESQTGYTLKVRRKGLDTFLEERANKLSGSGNGESNSVLFQC